ncbi:MAG: hypothetical protein KatS3mg110_0016 [Pirellulaceae bacterium]|nr:MAG: hypothetical protein KatS3mg110_0016 [Pirellulaceae bacterium]
MGLRVCKRCCGSSREEYFHEQLLAHRLRELSWFSHN